VQIETGLADVVFQRGPDVHVTTYTVGSSEFRFGLTPRLEAEATWAPLIVKRARGSGQRTGSAT